MGKKAEVGTPKYIANKMKAKGLQKLRWYCQMCSKQCRDENGFKCHTMSESHQRQLLLFADNSKKYMDEFSYELSREFVQILRRQFGTKRVAANRVYQEYIADRNHVHMNSTRWVTLTGFVKWLGKTGKCIIDETEKGWYITYVEKDPDQIAKEERKNKKIKMDKDDEERTLEFIEKQVKHAQEVGGETSEPMYTEFVRENEEEKVALDIKLESKSKVMMMVSSMTPLNKLVKPGGSSDDVFKKPKDRKRTAMEELMEQEEKRKEKNNRKDYWLTEGIVVKVMTKSLGEEYYKAKGVIREVKDRYCAIVKLLEGGKKIKLDQEHLETVIPAIGKLVKIVNGAYRRETATLLNIDERNYCADLEIQCGVLKGRKIKGIEYEDFCKIDDQE